MFNAICSFEWSPDPTDIKQLDIHPKDYDISDDIVQIKGCCFPANITSDNNGVQVFNTNNYTGHSYVFPLHDKYYAIVILTVSFKPCLFTDFLESVKKSLLEDTTSDCDVRFGLIRSLLTSWELSSEKLIVNYPFNQFTIDLAATENWTQSYDISPVSSAIDPIWKSLLSNQGILILGATAEICSNAVLAILSIIEPLKYYDPLLIYTKSGDPRFQEILDGSTKYKLVGTTEAFQPKKGQFGVVINIPDGHFTPCPELQNQYQQKTTRFFSVVLSAMNQALYTDPYFDILEKPISNIQTYTQNSPLFQKQFFDRVEKTETFRHWRNRKKIREQTRGAFLSVPSSEALKKLPDDKLIVAQDEVTRIYNTANGDQHYQTVLKIHLKAIAKRIKGLPVVIE
ncbi:hypothetical protein TVAG_445710 [Trichomonas vaginalis G3]|uniref:Uncharacterized protein n=1 Tax=Trichomonas vaginalis (strain ATCC PRA-98 / G3) TaxID=412133 RepID=A2FW65_TRIV3|nr:UDENN domain family [Trichomonas vaginalis G3]EAX90851.1 hypothetical protein TVAG_445710 [Trichomonas vaginalis G3]KAI5542518.1 UDENN domain family [Trichomonas vaginalis G3]|eukprot:XP_001303781.1 hypothetical protein [Trichomonas vaginalis G3]